jgi:amino acid adenylation domain-containing protein
MLGVLKTGGFFVPLDPTVPVARTQHMISDCAASVIITEESIISGIDGSKPSASVLLSVSDLDLDRPSEAPSIDVSPSDAAYVVYTSGSTGAPKGVVQDHKHLLHNVLAHTESFEITSSDRQTLLYPFNVYGSIRDTFNALLNGASLHILSVKNEELASLPDWLSEQRITIYCSVATIFRHLCRWIEDNHSFPDLRIIKLGGEVVFKTDVDLYKKHFPSSCRLSCGLAATEIGAVAQYFIDKNTEVSGNTALLGFPVPGKEILLVDGSGEPVEDGAIGEILIRSRYIAKGYLNKPDLNAEKFSTDPLDPLCRIYRTGDLGQKLENGMYIHRGRKDTQVKIRGNRIETADVELAILQTNLVGDAAVIAAEDVDGQLSLVAFYDPPPGQTDAIDPVTIRSELTKRLPGPMIPSYFVKLPKIPLTPNGKKDRQALKAIPFRTTSEGVDSPRYRTQTQRVIAEILSKNLGILSVDPSTNLFELGADSLKLVAIHRNIKKALQANIAMVDLFRHPTLDALSTFVDQSLIGSPQRAETEDHRSRKRPAGSSPIAIIGMSVRAGGVYTLKEYWAALESGSEAFEFPADDELRRRGENEKTLSHPNYVRATTRIEHIEGFDHSYFKMTPREAELLDPQMRLLLECSVEALEDAGYTASTTDGDVGVFASIGKSDYLYTLLEAQGDVLENVGLKRALLFNDRTYAATQVSYRLNLRGPSVHVDSACSSSLLAIHLACRSLQSGDCRYALAGGVRILVPHGVGYVHGEAGIEASDGRVKPFDIGANGTVFGNGAGVILLKRLDDALRDNDHIYAVIRGSGVSNDGSSRVGYTAPTVSGQVAAIRAAHIDAGIAADEVSYIECHGTGTYLGDPIEITALSEAFNERSPHHPCPIGSLKANFGHLSTAAGVAGVIKVALMLKNGRIPPSINFSAPNPNIGFDRTPFYVNTQSAPWIAGHHRRIAGVSAFGLGGTNAHLILEEAPQPSSPPVSVSRPRENVFVVSARSERALRSRCRDLARALHGCGAEQLEDVAYSLAVGREHGDFRLALAAGSSADLVSQLGDAADKQLTRLAHAEDRRVIFMFPGQGAQHLRMLADLYGSQPVFRATLDSCAELLRPLLGEDIRDLTVSLPFGLASDPTLAAQLSQTRIVQPALFAFEYSLAVFWKSLGIEPAALIGHSIGEYVAACLAGVFSLEEALRVVTMRGRLMQSAEPGQMVAVNASEDEIAPIIGSSCWIAAVNGPRQTVISGRLDDISRCIKAFEEHGLRFRKLNTSHAFHSGLMDSVLSGFRASFDGIRLNEPQLPVISNVTGTWLTAAQATNPDYWVEHLRSTVWFHKGLEALRPDETAILLEVGPGQTLTALCNESYPSAKFPIIPSCRHPRAAMSDQLAVSAALGRLWEAGTPITWQAWFQNHNGKRIPLPTYPFDRSRHWLGRRSTQSLPTSDRRDRSHEQQPIIVSLNPNETSDAVRSAWTQLLGITDFTDQDDFFALGGDSMVLVQVQKLLAKRLAVEIELSDLYRLPTVNQLAGHLASLLKQKALRQGSDDGRKPVHPTQAGSVDPSISSHLNALQRELTETAFN